MKRYVRSTVEDSMIKFYRWIDNKRYSMGDNEMGFSGNQAARLASDYLQEIRDSDEDDRLSLYYEFRDTVKGYYPEVYKLAVQDKIL